MHPCKVFRRRLQLDVHLHYRCVGWGMCRVHVYWKRGREGREVWGVVMDVGVGVDEDGGEEAAA